MTDKQQNAMRMIEALNERERMAFDIVVRNAADAAGYDFAFTDEVTEIAVKSGKFTAQQIGAYLTDLDQKELIEICGKERNENGWYQQIIFPEDIYDLIVSPEYERRD